MLNIAIKIYYCITYNTFDNNIFYRNNKLNSKIDIPKNFPKAEHLNFELNESLESAIEKAKISVDK